ncbi:alkene reductase [Candidatus Kapabacteria bacterium]|nr:alkene reductase [Candidatus Kapabacteria bacterium]
MNLLKPYSSNHLNLKNKVVMAPLTRSRSGKTRVPNEMNNIYYTQRSSAGLIISEATVISERAVGYIDTPGIYNDEQINGWKRITKSIKRYGGKIYCQLWHTGRSSHPDFHNGKAPLAPSSIKPSGKVTTYDGMKEKEMPSEMTHQEINTTIDEFKNAAKNAITAGFDGVEIHGANGYLIDQFLCDGSNIRTDNYGGNLQNRLRFPLEVVKAVGEEIGFDKTAIRISPSGTFNDMFDSDPKATFGAFVKELNQFDLSYLHISRFFDPRGDLNLPDHYLNNSEMLEYFRNIYKGTIIACNSFDKESGEATLNNGEADLIAYGKLFISNPDLVLRFEKDAELLEWDNSTFYGGAEKGYIDYPFLLKE